MPRRKRTPGTKPASRHAEPAWPELPLAAWKDTYDTLHRILQVVGKVRMELSPPQNHWWHVTLYLTSRGLTTSPIPSGTETFQIDLDFIDHEIHVVHSNGASRTLALHAHPVAEFYRELMIVFHELGVNVRVWPKPVEMEERTPMDRDFEHAAYDPEYAHRFWRALLQSDRVMHRFRSRFIGKASPVHLFWGACDLAVTRFSGRRAPEHPGAPNVAHFVAREAYSHEVSSCGFWPGGGGFDEPAYYSYCYPEPEGFRHWPVEPSEAFYHDRLREFILPYEAVRLADNPDEMLLDFFESTYEAAAELGHWDRLALEPEEEDTDTPSLTRAVGPLRRSG